jgi:hypothetical protein
MATKREPEAKAEPTTEPGMIPESERPQPTPQPSVEDGSGDNVSFGEPEPERHPSGRKKRSDAGRPRSGSPGTGRPPKVKESDKAAAGATMLYGGVGMILGGTGLAPAAGYSMAGLADEAGPPIAEWAKNRSPRFYKFLSSISDSVGIGKFAAAPVAAEMFVRVTPMRPALGPVVEAVHGADAMPGFVDMANQYDEYRAQVAAESNGRMDAEVPPDEME